MGFRKNSARKSFNDNFEFWPRAHTAVSVRTSVPVSKYFYRMIRVEDE
jgi:hypothetical protein